MNHKKCTYFFVVFLMLLSGDLFAQESLLGLQAPVVNGPVHEFILRLTPQLGVFAGTEANRIDMLIKQPTPIAPELNLDIQIKSHWYGSISFTWVSSMDREVTDSGATTFHSSLNVLAPTFGIKYIGWADNPEKLCFLDNARWWFGLEAGDYMIYRRGNVANGIINSHALTFKNNFGFNAGAGFDYYFTTYWGAGLQVKLHYISYSYDDLFIVTVGPNIIARF